MNMIVSELYSGHDHLFSAFQKRQRILLCKMGLREALSTKLDTKATDHGRKTAHGPQPVTKQQNYRIRFASEQLHKYTRTEVEFAPGKQSTLQEIWRQTRC
ncbi:Hypothetical_protein [Hexamita inflata]|uniref:Hypothetical_protein n=1 Tax=Hexamita inflata TaxID=28002 RepID=A0AA86TJJ0_9EUKA|nr:Hypothetical protein HINF_LOCUS6796 [Hexamita inflata]